MTRVTTRKALIVDDDLDLTHLLKSALMHDGFEVEVAHNGREGLLRARAFRPDLILLDILMPDMDGWEALRRLRALTGAPIVIVTALDGEDARVRGLDLGADDYITMPFGLQELRARLQAVLRRAAMPHSPNLLFLRFDGGRLVIDPCSHKVIAQSQPVRLTPTEYKLLLCLAFNAGRVLSHS